MTVDYSTMTTSMTDLVRSLQDTICSALEAEDTVKFKEDLWTREGGGGGRTRILEDGTTFEKAGVNTSAVEGHLKGQEIAMFKGMLAQQNIQLPDLDEAHFYATGVSLVIHPRNPFVPTTHANYRYFELNLPGEDNIWWFGGGADLTPYYLFEDDATHFHTVHKTVCDNYDPTYYPEFKEWCDRYFYLPHRQETRGIGGIFYDYKRQYEKEHYYNLASDLGNGFLDAYMPIVQKRNSTPYTDAHVEWQELRHGRYAEFNLIWDRGTSFGLKTGGRTESILMSLPAKVQWKYDYHPKPNSEEAKLIACLSEPRRWA